MNTDHDPGPEPTRVALERDGHVAIITFENPPLNIITAQLRVITAITILNFPFPRNQATLSSVNAPRRAFASNPS